MRKLFAVSLSCLIAAPALAADLNISIEVPKIDVAEYHKPYVAVWIAREDASVAANLSVWYQQTKAKDAQSGKEEPGSKWLADLRQWWRRSGRDTTLPIDGVSGATRPVGQHQLSFSSGNAPLGDLAPGKYTLMVEAAREVGGREVKSIAFDWPPTQAQSLKAQGNTELGAIALELKP